jgi:alkylation response protein AidB-like acyl-CoA dehydrogenase
MKIKGGDFLIHKTDPLSVFVPEEWNEEQLMLRDMIHDFLEKELHHLSEEPKATKDLEFIVGLLEKSATLGLCGLSIPTEYGGTDLDFNTGLLFTEAMARGFSFATTIGAHVSIGSLPIVYYGNENQKKKYLPKIATAELKTAYALTEPSAGSDANSGKTKALIDDNKSQYIITGQKMWITNAGFADLFIVFAKIEEDKNLSAFIVERTFKGISFGEEEKKLGIKGSSTRQVFFTNCPVPKENLLGKREQGFKIALNILNSGRIKLASGAVGGSKFALNKAISYSIERKQFGKSIYEFTAMQHKMGEMARKIFASESAVYRIGKCIDNKEDELKQNNCPKNEVKLKALREFAIECALMKVYSSEVLDFCVDEALQIHGGMGYSTETGVEMGYRDARITRIYEGTNEINRMLAFGELIKRGFKTKELNLKFAGKKVPASLLKRFLKIDKLTPQNVIENYKHLFLILSKYAADAFDLDLEHEQEIIMNLSDILGEIYVAESVYLRVKKLKSLERPQGELEHKENLTRLQLYEANLKIVHASNTIVDSLPDTRNKLLRFYVKLLTPQPILNPTKIRRSIAKHLIENKQYPW